MSLKDCIVDAIAAGEMHPERGREAIELYDALEAQFRQTTNALEAQRRAAAQTVTAVKAAAVEKKRRLLLQSRVARRIETELRGYRNLQGEPDLPNALLALLDRDELAGYSNVEARRKAILGQFHGRMAEVLATFRRDMLGRTRNKATLQNLVREVFGADTGDASAREMAKAWGETAELARLRFNAAGGRIPKRADWGMPQHHDTLKVRQASFDEWRDFILPKLDTGKMLDETTGLPLTGKRLDTALRRAYDDIRTDGFASMTPSGAAGGKALANRRLDHRFLVFRNPDDWLAYQERFGTGDAFSVMVGHLEGMARDIARMEILGPSDAATLRWLTQMVEKDAALQDANAGTTGRLDRARGKIKQAEDIYDHITGTANMPVDGRLARGFGATRMFLQSAQLGSAAVSAITDPVFGRMATKFAGLPQARTIGRTLKLLRPTVTEDQLVAVRSGLIAEGWSSQAIALQRYTGEITGPEYARRISDFVMRASGLSPWTQSGRWAFGMEFMATLAESAGKTFDRLDPALQKTLTRYGLGGGQWDRLRATPLYQHPNDVRAKFLRPDEIAARTDIPDADRLATRLLEMVQTETEFAVPSTSLRGRVLIVSDARPGTPQGELLRSVAMYKNFAVTLAFTHLNRAMLQQGALAKGRYLAELAIGATLMGAVALQLKQVSQGKDPRPMAGEKAAEFWGAALLQGGGLGIFGDFLFSDVNRFGGGLAQTIAGPVVSFADDARRLVIGNLLQLPGDQPTNFGRELTRFLGRYTPGGSLWYARKGYEALFLDQLQRHLDPEAERAWRSTARKTEREYGQRYWWPRGSAAPERAPDLSNAFEGGA